MSSRDDRWWEDHDRHNEKRDESIRFETSRANAFAKRENEFYSKNWSTSANNPGFTPKEVETKPIDVQLTDAVIELRMILQAARSIPGFFITLWITTLDNTNTTGTINLIELENVFKSMKRDCKNIGDQVPYWDMNKGMRYAREVADLNIKLDWIIRIIEHICSYVAKHNQSLER
jgi:hypothetical protein